MQGQSTAARFRFEGDAQPEVRAEVALESERIGVADARTPFLRQLCAALHQDARWPEH